MICLIKIIGKLDLENIEIVWENIQEHRTNTKVEVLKSIYSLFKRQESVYSICLR